MKRIIVFGAGLVAKPLVEYLVNAGYDVTVASRTRSKAMDVVRRSGGGEPMEFDIIKDKGLQRMVGDHDVAVSLLPYIHHDLVANAVVKQEKHLVTTSYVSDSMKDFQEPAKEAGSLLMNEMGLDPGMDHMEAKRIIDEVHERGGEVNEFISYCGGLPAPEANDNPWGYKFSWSPKGVVLASRNSARFKKDGEILRVPGKELFASYDIVEIPGRGTFEGYPNRDSVPYGDIYSIPESGTVLRGTLRNKGWCDTWKGLHDIGLLREEPTDKETFGELMEELVPGEGDLEKRIIKHIDTRDDRRALENWKWLGLLSNERIEDRDSMMGSFSHLLERKLVYRKDERDMIILQHTFRVSVPDEGSRIVRSTMVDHGIPGGDSAMSRTVGIPAAIGTQMMAEGKLDHLSGVHIPILPEVYGPALKRLEEMGIEFKEG